MYDHHRLIPPPENHATVSLDKIVTTRMSSETSSETQDQTGGQGQLWDTRWAGTNSSSRSISFRGISVSIIKNRQESCLSFEVLTTYHTPLDKHVLSKLKQGSKRKGSTHPHGIHRDKMNGRKWAHNTTCTWAAPPSAAKGNPPPSAWNSRRGYWAKAATPALRRGPESDGCPLISMKVLETQPKGESKPSVTSSGLTSLCVTLSSQTS